MASLIALKRVDKRATEIANRLLENINAFVKKMDAARELGLISPEDWPSIQQAGIRLLEKIEETRKTHLKLRQRIADKEAVEREQFRRAAGNN
jgi:hypothetical protein